MSFINEWVGWVAGLAAISALAVAANIHGGLKALRAAKVALFGDAHDLPVLQYTSVTGHMGCSNNVPKMVEIHVGLDNPESVTLRLKLLRAHVDYAGLSIESEIHSRQVIDIAPRAYNVGVASDPLLLPDKLGNEFGGHIDFIIEYGVVKADGSCEFGQELQIRGTHVTRLVQSGVGKWFWAGRFAPDPGTPALVMPSDAVANPDGSFAAPEMPGMMNGTFGRP